VLETQALRHKDKIMPDESAGRVSNEALKAQLQGVGSKIEDVKTLLVCYEDRIRSLERAGDKTTPIITKRIEDLESVSKDHDQELKDLTKLINTQAQSIQKLTDSFATMQTIWKWALGIFTVVMTAVIILLITGQAEVIFK
jgi:hypothetical protein